MIDALIKIIIALIALLFADAVTKEITGEHIHEHLFKWWREINDRIQTWLHENKETLKITHVMLVMLDACDDIAVRTKNVADMVTLGIYGTEQNNEHMHTITQAEVPYAEALQQFPELREKPVMIMEA